MNHKHALIGLVFVFLGLPMLLCVGCIGMVAVVGTVQPNQPNSPGEVASKKQSAPPDSDIAKPSSVPVEQSKKPERQKASESLQNERLEFIGTLKKEQIVQKIETPGTIPRCYVLPKFYQLTFDDKTSFMSVCFAWCYQIPKDAKPETLEILNIYDAMSGKQVGKFTEFGLKMY